MECNIITPAGLKINGGTEAYGGQLQSFAMSLSGLEAQIKATVNLVGTELVIPEAGDLVIIESQNMLLNFQVGGYNISTSATGATTMTLSLYDLSNVLDNRHIVLREEVPEDGLIPDNITILGVKYGPITEIPRDSDGNDFGIETSESTTRWGDVRKNFETAINEEVTVWCPNETQEEKRQRINQRVTSSTGKTLWQAGGPAYTDAFSGRVYHTLESALGDLLQGGIPIQQETTSTFFGGGVTKQAEFDFKGTFREVIMQYANALGLQAWWDLETNAVNIAETRSSSEGFNLLSQIAESCDVTSASTQEDFTTTFAKGAIGSYTSSNQGENAEDAGTPPSKFLKAFPLKPIFKYRRCYDEPSQMKAFSFEDRDVLKAITASIDPQIWAAYVLQQAIGKGKDQSEETRNQGYEFIIGKDASEGVQALCDKITIPGASEEADKQERDLTATEWKELIRLDSAPPYKKNKFLQYYYQAQDTDAWLKKCTASLIPITIGDLLPEGEGDDEIIGVPLMSALLNAAHTANLKPSFEEGAAKEPPLEEPSDYTGWNTQPDKDPMKTLGNFGTPLGQDDPPEGKSAFAAFNLGKILIKPNGDFDQILDKNGLTGDNDILRLYLSAIAKFRNQFWILKEDTGECEATSVNVTGRTYGYYITSSVQNAPMNFKPQDSYEERKVDPFAPIGSCGCQELVDLAKAAALMYLPSDVPLDNIMGRPAIPNSPIKALRKEKPGVAVIDFIYALESSGENFKDFNQKKPGLELLFSGDGKKADPEKWWSQRRGGETKEDGPKLQLHLYIQPSDFATSNIQNRISFLTNVEQVEEDPDGDAAGNLVQNNQGELQTEQNMDGPAKKLASEMLISLTSTLGANMGSIESNPIQQITSNNGGKAQAKIENICGPDGFLAAYELWGLKTDLACGENETIGDEEVEGPTFLDFHGKIPAGFMKLPGNAEDIFSGKPFLPQAQLSSTPEEDFIEIAYDVTGATNSFRSSDAGKFTLTAMIPPANNCWKSKFDFGVSVNAADIGRLNQPAPNRFSTPFNVANSYSTGNRSLMHAALYRKLANASVADTVTARTDNITFLATGNNWQIPTIAQGLENFSISTSGGKTQVTLSVGNTRQREAAKAQFERMVQFPTAQYRPGSFMPSTWNSNASPQFQNRMRGIK